MSEKPYMIANVALFSGNADLYHRTHPQPPAVLIDRLSQLAQVEMPALVVDLGCGTGLSTRLWAGRAQHVIGIDPSEDMLRVAQAGDDDDHMRYQRGFNTQTELPDACADIVTASQALPGWSRNRPMRKSSAFCAQKASSQPSILTGPRRSTGKRKWLSAPS
jgi:SAM-dependent methyltransferase